MSPQGDAPHCPQKPLIRHRRCLIAGGISLLEGRPDTNVLAPKSGDVFTRDTLAAVIELTEASWRIPYAIRVNSLTNFPHTRAEGDDLIIGELMAEFLRWAETNLRPTREGNENPDLAKVRRAKESLRPSSSGPLAILTPMS